MAERTMTVRGGRDLGDCVQIDGTWYIRRDSFWMDAEEMEDGWDVQVETGYYSNLELPATEEDRAFVTAFVAEKERKEAERMSKIYRESNTALFVPEVGQRVEFRYTGNKGKIVELSSDSHHIRVLQDGKKAPLWWSPFYFKLEGSANETFYDLNEVIK